MIDKKKEEEEVERGETHSKIRPQEHFADLLKPNLLLNHPAARGLFLLFSFLVGVGSMWKGRFGGVWHAQLTHFTQALDHRCTVSASTSSADLWDIILNILLGNNTCYANFPYLRLFAMYGVITLCGWLVLSQRVLFQMYQIKMTCAELRWSVGCPALSDGIYCLGMGYWWWFVRWMMMARSCHPAQFGRGELVGAAGTLEEKEDYYEEKEEEDGCQSSISCLMWCEL